MLAMMLETGSRDQRRHLVNQQPLQRSGVVPADGLQQQRRFCSGRCPLRRSVEYVGAIGVGAQATLGTHDAEFGVTVVWEPTAARTFDFEAGAGGKLLPPWSSKRIPSPDPPVFPHFIHGTETEKIAPWAVGRGPWSVRRHCTSNPSLRSSTEAVEGQYPSPIDNASWAF